jgi:isochorismate synthase
VPSSKQVSLHQFYAYCVENCLPLALYHLSGTSYKKVVAQRNEVLNSIKGQNHSAQNGFIFAPFQADQNRNAFIIAPDIFCSADELPALNFAKNLTKRPAKIFMEKIKAASRKDYIHYVKSIQQQIKKGGFKKIVAARVVKTKKPNHFNAVSFFEALCKKYSSAFVSLVYTPQHGLWIGASPEILLQVEGNTFKTFSLAGTKAAGTKKGWGKKEEQEQKIVSDYITGAFAKVTKNKPMLQGPETVEAGNLMHLRTTFTYKGIPTNKWSDLVNKLHPTPAVAGLPKQESIDFIIAHEKAPRAYYSGYLGPVNLDKQTNLFVNLRCMQVLKNKLAIYVGCGITVDSKPADEWKESKMKSETLLRVLNN